MLDDPSGRLPPQDELSGLCSAFERAWESGHEPKIDTYLGRVAPELRDSLADALNAIVSRMLADRPTLSGDDGGVGEASSPAGSTVRSLPGDAGETEDGDPTMAFEPQVKPTALGEFGDYQLLCEVARGGMGVVYRARQRSLNRIVALKMILSGEMASASEQERFQAEAQAAAHLEHPGIVPIYEIGEHGGRRYFSMGFVRGRSLANRLLSGALEPYNAAEIVSKIADAVDYAHRQGVIHRDLKPGNVLLSEDGEPRITDFGLAKRVEGDSGLTATGQILGTPSFMPPEQAMGLQTGPAADIYALGAILYTTLTGRAPHRAADPLNTLKSVIDREPVAPRSHDRDVPRDLETICLKALSKEPQRRYPNAAAFAADLRRFVNHQPIAARRVSSPEKILLWCKRRPRAALTAMLLMAAVIVLAVAVQWRVSAGNAGAIAERLKGAVSSVASSRGALTPRAIEDLRHEDFDEADVVDSLRRRYQASPPNARLGLAYGLAVLGDVRVDYLVDQIGSAPGEEVGNICDALSVAPREALRAIDAKASASEETREWQLKARLAIVALHLGDVRLATDMHRMQDRSDPIQQTVFILDAFPDWHGDLSKLANILPQMTTPSAQAGMCLALGRLDDLGDARSSLVKLVVEWFRSSPHAGVHSAARWALQRWQEPTPSVEAAKVNASNFHWRMTPTGLTLIRIPAGEFLRTETGAANGIQQRVRLSKAFWLADSEVSAGIFHRFMTDDQYAGPRPAEWKGATEPFVPSAQHPAHHVSWESAVMFCNWLSQREQRAPCYRISEIGDSLDRQKTPTRTIVATFLPHGDGYRLPTEAEWEYACRAGTSTEFAFGDDRAYLPDYGVASTEKTALVRTKMCNRWGLFDMHGNVAEWMLDSHHEYEGPFQVDPLCIVNDPLPTQMIRGGSWESAAQRCSSAHRDRHLAIYSSQNQGFRVALNAPAPSSDPMAARPPASPPDAALLDATLPLGMLDDPGPPLTPFSDTPPGAGLGPPDQRTLDRSGPHGLLWEEEEGPVFRPPNIRESLAQLAMGRGMVKAGRLKQAVAAFNKAIQLEPNLVPAWLGLAIALRDFGQQEDARKAYQRVVDLVAAMPANTRSKVDWASLGQAQFRLGQWQSAKAALNQANHLRHEQRPALSNAPRWWFLAMTLHHLGDHERALAIYQQLVANMTAKSPLRMIRLQAEAKQLLERPPAPN